MHAVSEPPVAALDEPDEDGAALEVTDDDPPAGWVAAELLPPPPLEPQADRASATAATPAIAALVRRPRTIVIPSNTGGSSHAGVGVSRHRIGGEATRKAHPGSELMS